MTKVLALLATIPLISACASIAAQTGGSPGYRALGTEPFWSIHMTPEMIIFDEANAPGVKIEQSIDRRGQSVEGTRYVGSPRLQIWITSERCSDGMSDRIFPDRVLALVDGRRFEGCGGQPLSDPGPS